MEQPSYYAILTASVRYDNRLTDSEKILYAEITALSNAYGFCTASDEHFAKLYRHNKSIILSKINHLRKLGYLKITYKYIDDILQRQIIQVLYESEGGKHGNL